MKPQWIKRASTITSGLLLSAFVFTQVGPTAAAPFSGNRTTAFADNGFQATWSRTDSEGVRGGRSWYWGPNPWFDYAEFYRQGVNGLRTVQYFDKARMEINNANDRSYQLGVTNGLLVKEMVSGRLQLGNDPYDVDQRSAADVPVAGNPRADNPNAPGYASFAGIATVDNGYRDAQKLGQRINVTLDRSGNLGVRDDLTLPETEIVQFNSVTGHNIPRVFWDFMNLQGRVAENGRVTTGPVVDWLFAMGLPITDAYWTRARVGGEEKDVLIQLFERRALTYVPSNPAGYRVEMGNVGQHYFQWRYPHLGQPWAAPDPNPPIIIHSDQGTNHWELFAYYSTGLVQLTKNSAESTAYSWRRSYDPKEMRLLGDSRRGGPNFRQIFEYDPAVIYGGQQKQNIDTRRLSYSDGTQPPADGPYPGYLPNGTANDFNPAYSPDGTKIAFASDRMGKPELFLMPWTGNSPVQLTSNGCTNESPTWSPDGRTLYWANDCTGNYEVYKADLVYRYESSYGIDAGLTNITQLTNSPGADRYPRVSPDGTTIAFTSDRDGRNQIYNIDTDGRNEFRLFIADSNAEAATWSADGNFIAYASDADGDWDIYTIRANGEGTSITNITNNNADDRWALWAQ